MMNPKDKISQFFTYGEATRYNKQFYGEIDNNPTQEHLRNLIALAKNIADPCRMFVGGPLDGIFYRSPAMNSKTPGADPNSQHMIGQAVDLDCDTYGFSTNKKLFDFIRTKLDFDVLIWEKGTEQNPAWVHVSYRLPIYGLNRKIIKRVKPDGTNIYFDLY
jgi:hypothetical protein